MVSKQCTGCSFVTYMYMYTAQHSGHNATQLRLGFTVYVEIICVTRRSLLDKSKSTFLLLQKVLLLDLSRIAICNHKPVHMS